jgi:hypothetical protein
VHDVPRLRSFLAIAALLFTWIGGSAPANAAPIAPQPFVAKYAASYRGMEAGTVTFSLQRDAATGRYIYESTAEPSFLARLVVSRDVAERSEMLIDEKGVRPLEWRFDDGRSGDAKDGALSFAWESGRVSGTIEQHKIDFPTQERMQDRLSIQIHVATQLLRGEEPGTVPMIDDNRVKEYTYARTGTATLDTPLGKIDTVIYESTRPGSSRVARFWLAPSLEYLPMRAEQVRKGKVETVMVIKSLDQ